MNGAIAFAAFGFVLVWLRVLLYAVIAALAAVSSRFTATGCGSRMRVALWVLWGMSLLCALLMMALAAAAIVAWNDKYYTSEVENDDDYGKLNGDVAFGLAIVVFILELSGSAVATWFSTKAMSSLVDPSSSKGVENFRNPEYQEAGASNSGQAAGYTPTFVTVSSGYPAAYPPQEARAPVAPA